MGPVWRDTQIPDSEFPSFRGPLLGPSPRDPQIPDSEFPSFRGPLYMYGVRTSLSQRDTHIPDSEFPSFRGLLLQGPSPYPSPRDPQIPDSEFPSFRGALSGPTRREPKCQIPRFRVSGRPLGLTLHVGYRAADSRIQRAVSISAPVPILNNPHARGVM